MRQIRNSKRGGFYSMLPLLGAILVLVILSLLAIFLGYFLNKTNDQSAKVNMISTTSLINDMSRMNPEGKKLYEELDKQTAINQANTPVLDKTLNAVNALDPNNKFILIRYDYSANKIDGTVNAGMQTDKELGVILLPKTIVVASTQVPISMWTVMGSEWAMIS